MSTGKMRQKERVRQGLYEVFDFGSWRAVITRACYDGSGLMSRFTLTRVRPRQSGGVSRVFTAQDVLDLPRFTQLLAEALATNCFVDRELKNELLCLRDSLAELTGTGGPEKHDGCDRPGRGPVNGAGAS